MSGVATTGGAAGGGKPAGTMKETERVVAGPGPGRGPMGGGMVGQKANDFKASTRRLLRGMTPERPLLVLVGLFAVGSVTLMALGPKLLGHATDLVFNGFIAGRLHSAQVTQEQAIEAARASGDTGRADMLSGLDLGGATGIDFDAVGHALMIVLAVYVAGSLLAWLQGLLVNRIVQRSVRRMRADVEDKVNSLPLSYFDRQPRGELLSRVTNDIDNVAQTLQQTMSQLLTSLMTVVAVLAMMFWISPLLALIALVTIPLAMLVTGKIMKRSQVQFIQQWRQTGKINAHVEEAISGHALVSVFGRRAEVEREFAEQNEGLYDSSWRAQFVSGLIMPLMMLVGNINYVLIAVVGGLRVTSGALSIGDVQAFIQYSRQFTQPLTQVASMVNLLQSGVASAERVFELLDAEEQVPDRPATEPIGETRGEVAFEGVSFSYREDEPLITDLSLVARPGQTVAIVGPTGAGKTTLVNLIMRFYELDAGRITLDGVDITEMTRAELRGRIGMVLQDTWLFEGTIEENIRYGRPDATDEEVLAAARATYVDRFVHSLPEGYATRVDDEGSNLSAGERQLITIARAFLAQPALLILDEATSSVDTRTEVLVQHAMAALRRDRTSFVIAHRLSTIRDADLILVMEDGRIVEQGGHAELLAAGGPFARLHAAQFAAAVS
ncbi:ABC transporter ATP-binding protein [Nocardioides sp. GY 10113]|uniref:ABC transporter ATP-binding protein n=1 Tax=Nocardioides sp. GY 10113 TaxID=2569761 RepID=UPI0010A8E6F0|nr:ABC transporter ATP-binding protein [Nocardioides sp. GY 10113]TIC88215.1 ABC transporter ATP-binding protein [Nocardioides sp. GY 10113]